MIKINSSKYRLIWKHKSCNSDEVWPQNKKFIGYLLEGLVDEINTYTGHCGAVNAVSLNGELAASGSGDRQVHLWNTATCSPRATYHHAHVVESVSFVDSNILSGSWDGELKLFDIHHDHARTLLQVSRLFLAFAIFVLAWLISSIAEAW